MRKRLVPLHICSQQYFTFFQPLVFVFHTSITELDDVYFARFVHLGNKVEEWSQMTQPPHTRERIGKVLTSWIRLWAQNVCTMSCIWKNNALKNNSLVRPNHKSDSHKHTWCRLMSVHSQIIRLFHWKNITCMWRNVSVHLIYFLFFYPTFWLQEQLYITELLYRSFLNLMKDIDLISKNKCFVTCWLSFTEVFSLFPSVVVMLAFEWGKTQMTKINT